MLLGSIYYTYIQCTGHLSRPAISKWPIAIEDGIMKGGRKDWQMTLHCTCSKNRPLQSLIIILITSCKTTDFRQRKSIGVRHLLLCMGGYHVYHRRDRKSTCVNAMVGEVSQSLSGVNQLSEHTKCHYCNSLSASSWLGPHREKESSRRTHFQTKARLPSECPFLVTET